MLWTALNGRYPPKTDTVPEKRFEDLALIGRILLATPQPWKFATGDLDQVLYRGMSLNDENIGTIALSPDEIFGAFLVVIAQISGKSKLKELREAISSMTDSAHSRLRPMRRIMMSYLGDPHMAEAEKELGQLGFSPEQRALVWSWVQSRKSF
jgi:hypothetical protein